MNKPIVPFLILFSCNLMWSLQFTCVKLVQDQIGGIFTVWAPMLLATLLLIPLLKREGFRRRKLSWEDIRIFGSLALFGAFPAQVILTWGTQYSTASNAAIMTLLLPVITALFGYAMLNEKMNRSRWISFAIAITGVVLCSVGDLSKLDLGSHYVWGNFLLFVSIVGNGYYNTVCKRISPDYSEIEMLFYAYVATIIIMTPLVLYFEQQSFRNIPFFTPQTWTGLALLCFFHNFLSMVLFFKVLKVLDVTQIGLSNYLVTIFGLPIAAVWLGETLGPVQIAGGALVLLGTLIITLWDKNKMSLKPEENKQQP